MRGIKEMSVWIGAMVGTVTFLAAGLVPALLYGGYLGVMIGSTLKGAPIDAGGIGSYLILVGMAIGTISVWFLFVVAGSAVGASTSWLLSGGREESDPRGR